MSKENFISGQVEKKQEPDSGVSKHWEEEHRRLVEKVNMKVEMIAGLKDFVKENAFLEPAEFRAKLEEKNRQTLDSLGLAFIKKYLIYEKKKIELEKTRRTKQEIEEQNSWRLDESGSEESLEKFEAELQENEDWMAALKREEELEDELIEAKKDEDLGFFEKLKNFIEMISAKREMAKMAQDDYESDRGEFWNGLGDMTGIKLELLDTSRAKVIFSGHAVNIVLPEESYKKLFRDTSRGTHIHSSAYSFIMERPGYEATIDHENNHNLSESFDGIPMYEENLADNLSMRINNFERLKEMGAPEIFVDNEIRLLNEFLERYVCQNFTELIADFDRPFEEGARSYALNFMNSMDMVDGFIKKIQNEKIRQTLSNSQLIAEKRFVDHLNQLADIYFFAENFSGSDEVGASIILFGHENLQKTERYLKSKMGSDVFEMAKLIRPISSKGNYFSHIREEYRKKMRNGNYLLATFLDSSMQMPSDRILEMLMDNRNARSLFDLESVGKFLDLTESLSASGKNQELERLAEQIDAGMVEELDNTDSEMIVEKIHRASDLPELDKKMKRISIMLGVPEFHSIIENELLELFIEYKGFAAIKDDDFSLLRDLWMVWPQKRKKIAELLLMHVEEEYIFGDYESRQGKKYNKTTIKASGYWKFLQELGLEAKADEALHFDD